jgi:hypothetical protein
VSQSFVPVASASVNSAELPFRVRGEVRLLVTVETARPSRSGSIAISSGNTKAVRSRRHAEAVSLGDQRPNSRCAWSLVACMLGYAAKCKAKQPGRSSSLARSSSFKSLGGRSVRATHPPMPNPSVKGTNCGEPQFAPYLER